jgi:Transposase DDE domain group 1
LLSAYQGFERESLLPTIYRAFPLGYEDLNDHEQLRHDRVFGILAGREDLEQPLAGKSTLNRMELGAGETDRYKKITFWKDALDELLVKVFIESYAETPEQIVLDIDTTDLPLHGKQEGRFFHGYYAMTTTVIFRSTFLAASRCCARD